MIWSYGYCSSCQEDWAVSTASYSLPVICLTCGEMLDQYAQINFLPIMKQKAKKLTNTMLQHQEYCKESLLTNLSDSLLLEIGSYLHPLDSYHLGITTKKLHVPSTEISTRHFLSPLESNPLQAATLNCVNNVASRIVQESLIHGLARALSHSCNCFPLDMAKQLVKLQIDESIGKAPLGDILFLENLFEKVKTVYASFLTENGSIIWGRKAKYTVNSQPISVMEIFIL